MASQDKVNVLFIIKPERAAGAEMVLLEAAARLNRERFRVFAGLLTPDRENLLPPQLTPIDFNLPGLNGWVWLSFFCISAGCCGATGFKSYTPTAMCRAIMPVRPQP